MPQPGPRWPPTRSSRTIRGPRERGGPIGTHVEEDGRMSGWWGNPFGFESRPSDHTRILFRWNRQMDFSQSHLTSLPFARSGKIFPTRGNKPSLAWVGKEKIFYIRSLSVIPASAYCLNIMSFEVAERYKRENSNGRGDYRFPGGTIEEAVREKRVGGRRRLCLLVPVPPVRPDDGQSIHIGDLYPGGRGCRVRHVQDPSLPSQGRPATEEAEDQGSKVRTDIPLRGYQLNRRRKDGVPISIRGGATIFIGVHYPLCCWLRRVIPPALTNPIIQQGPGRHRIGGLAAAGTDPISGGPSA